MDNDTPVIYGLEFQTRALSAQTAETDIVRFLVGTQSLKFSNNQVHLVELNEETGNLKTQVFQHPIGEIGLYRLLQLNLMYLLHVIIV